jgi:HEPN domain-containing protein/predicted nucleotidyltransferase
MVRLAAGIDPTLEMIVAELARITRPELVLLFGSRAMGAPREDSDYDLLVVFGDHMDVERERHLCYDALHRASISADVLTRTASQYRRQQHDPGFLDWLVAREGRVLFATGAVEQRSPADRVREGTDGVTRWRQRAAADLREAQLSADSDTPVPDAICFHAHAAIEKLLKAEIAARGTFPPRTHDLMTLLELQQPTLRGETGLRSACEVLQRLYPKSRYPEEPMPTLEEAGHALEASLKARQAIVKLGS